MESPALDTGASLNTVKSSATQRSKPGGFSLTRLARMHDTLLRHVDSGRLPGLVALFRALDVRDDDVMRYTATLRLFAAGVIVVMAGVVASIFSAA